MTSYLLRLRLLAMTITISGCGATMTGQWSDDYKLGKLKGGTYTYLNQGAGFVIHSRDEDGMDQARALCGAQREPFVVNQHDDQSLGTAYQPTFSYSTGTISTGSGTANFSSTTRSGQWITEIRNFHSTTFLCPDADPQNETYALVYRNSPRCVTIPEPWTVGRARLEALWNDPENDICESEGWIRVNSSTDTRHLFIGPLGLSKCKSLAESLINEEVSTEMFTIIIRKKLTHCDQENNNHKNNN